MRNGSAGGGSVVPVRTGDDWTTGAASTTAVGAACMTVAVRRARRTEACDPSAAEPVKCLHAADRGSARWHAAPFRMAYCIVFCGHTNRYITHTTRLSDGAEADSCCPAQQMQVVNAPARDAARTGEKGLQSHS